MTAEQRRAVVIGGSLGGLTTALLLAEAGFSVAVYERSAELADRGAGIVAHPESLRYLVERGVAGLDELSITCANLRYLDRDGGLLHEAPVGYRFTSWFALYERLLDRLPQGSMHFSRALRDLSDDGDRVTVRLDGGLEASCDLLVCADGISSTARRLLQPGAEPTYAGYIGWRGTVPLAGLAPRLRGALAGHITYQLLDAGHTLAYPIPGARGGGGAPGAALNWIWYRRLDEGPHLTRAMTDAAGRHHELSVPPGLVATDVEGELRETSEQLLAGDLAELVRATPRPFIQRIVDVEVERMAFGRVCLLGDAAFVARPHAAAGTAKAAADGWSLAAEVSGADDVATALRRWEPRQLALGRSLVRRSRRLGEAQFAGDWVAGDPSLLFGLRAPGDSCFDAPDDGASARRAGLATGPLEERAWPT
jgi:2,6-dihydroxypyridine 3-monooxygenase